MSILSVRLDPSIEKKIAFLMEKGFIEDKSAFIRKLLDILVRIYWLGGSLYD